MMSWRATRGALGRRAGRETGARCSRRRWAGERWGRGGERRGGMNVTKTGTDYETGVMCSRSGWEGERVGIECRNRERSTASWGRRSRRRDFCNRRQGLKAAETKGVNATPNPPPPPVAIVCSYDPSKYAHIDRLPDRDMEVGGGGVCGGVGVSRCATPAVHCGHASLTQRLQKVGGALPPCCGGSPRLAVHGVHAGCNSAAPCALR